MSIVMAMAACGLSAQTDFVQVKDGHFVRHGEPYYYVGTNFWYGASLALRGRVATASACAENSTR